MRKQKSERDTHTQITTCRRPTYLAHSSAGGVEVELDQCFLLSRLRKHKSKKREVETDRVCVCVCVCVRERDRERERERDREREREREKRWREEKYFVR